MPQSKSIAATSHLSQALSVTLMPLFAHDILQVGSRGFGLLQSAGGSGALAGTFLAARLSHTGRQVHQTIAVIIGGALVAGGALRIVLSKQKMQLLDPHLGFSEMRASM